MTFDSSKNLFGHFEWRIRKDNLGQAELVVSCLETVTIYRTSIHLDRLWTSNKEGIVPVWMFDWQKIFIKSPFVSAVFSVVGIEEAPQEKRSPAPEILRCHQSKQWSLNKNLVETNVLQKNLEDAPKFKTTTKTWKVSAFRGVHMIVIRRPTPDSQTASHSIMDS